MKFLLIGDPIIDSYSIGDIQRISPEAPIPVSKFIKTEHTPGGSLNVASNLISLGLDIAEYYPIGYINTISLYSMFTSPLFEL